MYRGPAGPAARWRKNCEDVREVFNAAVTSIDDKRAQWVVCLSPCKDGIVTNGRVPLQVEQVRVRHGDGLRGGYLITPESYSGRVAH